MSITFAALVFFVLYGTASTAYWQWRYNTLRRELERERAGKGAR